MEEIILPTDTYSFKINVPFDGVVYIMKFDWNSRLLYWSYSLFFSNNEPILTGQRLIVSADLLSRFGFTGVPQKLLFLYDTQEKNEPPTFEGLGRRWRLMYGDII